MVLKIKSCPICDYSFETRKQSQIYCDSCREKRAISRFIESYYPAFKECIYCKEMFIIDRLKKKKNKRASNRVICDSCRNKRGYEYQLIQKFGKVVELICVVCGYDKGRIEEYNGHHVISRQIDVNGEIVVLCRRCHHAIHVIRKYQDTKLTDVGVENLGYLINKCTTRMGQN